MLLNKLDTFFCNAFLNVSGEMRQAHIRREAGSWVEFVVEDSPSTQLTNGYVVPMLPVEFHCHGIGENDFSDFDSLDLERINEDARQEGILCILCIFLPHQKLEAF